MGALRTLDADGDGVVSRQEWGASSEVKNKEKEMEEEEKKKEKKRQKKLEKKYRKEKKKENKENIKKKKQRDDSSSTDSSSSDSDSNELWDHSAACCDVPKQALTVKAALQTMGVDVVSLT